MPRYLSTSPFEQVIFGLSVGADGTAVHPADDSAPPDGSTVVLRYGDELDTADPVHFPGAAEIDPPVTAPAVTAPTTAEEPTP